MDELYGIKELYDVVIKATYNIENNGRVIEPGETILEFDNIQMAGLNDRKSYVAARGGFENREWVTWETMRSIPLTFTQGVFSHEQMSLIANARLGVISPETQFIEIEGKESLESDENGIITLSKTPLEKLFVYKKETGEKLDYTLAGNEITIEEPYQDVLVRYRWLYDGGGKVLRMGQQLFKSYLRLEGKTRLKDDKSGQVYTGIIVIPKLKLMSDLSIRLGRDVNPTVASFRAEGLPTGARGNSVVCNLYTLNDDIDADIG